jgi:hypothetical protein
MATTTPNYGWTVPTSTDLVKDGATAIETLGDAIDASMNTALGTKKAGMVLLNTTSFSGVSSVSFNDVFTSTYRNYKINFSAAVTGGGNVGLRLRASGSDNTSSNYRFGGMLIGCESSEAFFGSNNSIATNAEFQTNSGNITGATLEVLHPQITANTTILSTSAGNFFQLRGWMLTVTTIYDGFTIFSSANLAGKISVYGYNE